MRAEGLNLGAAPLIIPLGSSINLQTRIPQSSSLSGAQWRSTVFSCLKTRYFIYKLIRPLGGCDLRAWILKLVLLSYLLAPAFTFKSEFLNPQAWIEHSGIQLTWASYKQFISYTNERGHWGDESWGLESWSRTSDHTSWLQHSTSNQNSSILKPN